MAKRRFVGTDEQHADQAAHYKFKQQYLRDFWKRVGDNPIPSPDGLLRSKDDVEKYLTERFKAEGKAMGKSDAVIQKEFDNGRRLLEDDAEMVDREFL